MSEAQAPLTHVKLATETHDERIWRLATAAEREACAKIANAISDKAYAIYKGRASEDWRFRRGDPWADGYSDGAGDVAEQIMARGKA